VPKILIVDDNPANRDLLVALLGYGGHELMEASDGAGALALISAERPDLVITDILMPTMDGYELVRQLRAVKGMAQIPVIFCTAHFRERDAKDLARECGVSHVLTKPCEPETVIRAVDECLGRKSAARTPPVGQEFDREHLRLVSDKLLQQTRELTDTNLRLQALVDMSVQLASDIDPGQLLDRFCAGARELIASRCSLAGIPTEDGTGILHLSVAGVDGSQSDIRIPPDHELFRRAMENRRPSRLCNPGADPALLQLPASLPNFESLLIAPIVSPSRTYGWLCLLHRIGAPEFNAEDEHLAGTLAALVGRVYENARMYAKERLHAAELEREITERRKAQEESAQLADIVHSSEDAIIGMTSEGIIVSWNHGAERVFGYSTAQVHGKPIAGLFSPERSGELMRALDDIRQGRCVGRWETVGIKQDGSMMDMAVTMSPILKSDGSLSGVSAIGRDISAQKRLQQQFLVAQKMEAIGRLSAGVAHDFNNLLTVIGGYSGVLLNARSALDPEYPDLLEINKAAERASALTRQLLTFSRRQTTQPQVVDLNRVMAEMDRMLRRVIGEDIDLVTVLDPVLGPVQADPGQLEQVIMNLAVNARDAMAEGGKLTIQTANVDLKDTLSVRNSAVPRGSYVMLSVTDTGSGMDSATQDRIFEPFFTTKSSEGGTGLGLSTVYGIVEQSKGAIVVYSEPGRGTTFKIFLPRVGAVAPPPAPATSTAVTGRGSEVILVVEDEDSVRALICGILKRQGYTVLRARSGGEALVVGEQYRGKIHLMISDITMPGMTGVELARRFSTIRPEMSVLLMSGYAESAILHQQLLPPNTPFLEKPFVPQVLAEKVRKVLDSARATHPQSMTG
jgi:PAS domain S-box-containing protein